ncbi:MAG: DUF3427 domain-containing protein [Microthrixaceae bacterium]
MQSGEPARGLYEDLITEGLDRLLQGMADPGLVAHGRLESAEAADRLALHVSAVVERAVAGLPDALRSEVGAELVRRLVDALEREIVAVAGRAADLGDDRPVGDGTVLRSIGAVGPDGRAVFDEYPATPLLDTALLTNARGEPNLAHQLRSEIPSADRIDVVMAFVVRSGLAPYRHELIRHLEAGRPLRLITTTFSGITQPDVLAELADRGADIRVSYDISASRLHAKAWLFARNSGASTAFVGSSNLTRSGQETGLEWNVRVSARRNRGVVDRVSSVFDSYWESGDFLPFDPDEFRSAVIAVSAGPLRATLLPPTELRLQPFQERLLEQIDLARDRGHHRNLLVAATGTGKTVMAAVDYARLRARLPRSRLLFVAHRREILEQSRATFRHALREAAFGEMWVAGARPTEFDHVFASIQSLHDDVLEHLPPDHFDVVIVDEFHHAAAASYRRLLDRIEPAELLGLTATPERSDGESILEWFDGAVSAELRLWDAIDQRRLSPFRYYGISDGTDLSAVPWRPGQGYDTRALSGLYTADEAWARLVVRQLELHVDDVHRMRALGFCVNVEHAQFMQRVFDAAGVRAVAVWAETDPEERRRALEDLAAGRVNIVFAVDLFNEGVDVPVLDTVLFLRPTDSPVLFLQQLGRGLRLAPDKAFCTVLDFVGRHRKEFRYDRRFRALLGGTRKDLERQVVAGFPNLPAGCSLDLDPVAQARVLDSIRNAVPGTWPKKVQELRQVAAGFGGDVSLGVFLEHSGLELEDVFTGSAQQGWTLLRSDAGLPLGFRPDDDAAPMRAAARLLHVDDATRLDFWRDTLDGPAPPVVDRWAERDQRLLHMLLVQWMPDLLRAQPDARPKGLSEALSSAWPHEQLRHELVELFGILRRRVDHLHPPWAGDLRVPLQVHARYTRAEMQSALGDRAEGSWSVPAWREGVRFVEESSCDVFAFTLDKTSGHFSPTTRYQDYAISPELIHWQSQSTTSEDSPTGRRYIEHERLGSSILLFAREHSRERAFWFLGPATYVRHTGSRPMSVTWRLQVPLSGDLFASFAAAVA